MTVAYITAERYGVDFQDRINRLIRIDPEETPAFSMFGKVEAKADTHYFQSETLAAANKDNAAVQGADVTNASGDFVAPSNLLNYTQLLEKPFAAATSHSMTDKPGIGRGKMSTFNHEKAKKYIEMKRDGDAAILSNNDRVQPLPDTTTAGKLRGATRWITTNALDMSVTQNQQNFTTKILTRDMLYYVAKLCFDNGGRPKHIFTNSSQKLRMNEFTGAPTRDIDSTGSALSDAIHRIETIAGKQDIIVDQYMDQNTILMLELQYWKVAMLQAPDYKVKGVTGHADQGFTFMELTIECLAEKSSGKITNLD